MQVRIVHIFHNCFVIEAGENSYVFDIPAERFRSKKVLSVLQDVLAGKKVTAFFSHSHLDHFAPDYRDVCVKAASLQAVISDDIEEMYPDLDFGDALIVEPDEKYEFNGLEIETLMSNDLGVAFLFSTPEGLRIYNGGDLACWDWETASQNEIDFTRSFFRSAVDRVVDYGVQIAFSNVDRRLESLAGGGELARAVKPQIFVPTHAFGRTQWLEGLHERLGIDVNTCFTYRRSGDAQSVDIRT
ncbi:MBL fold metallo-hydrolase [Maridesulfovibrio sp.]|uniref:MBL fold metallo-hydrolase n=1 Tax=Maridesulfovibrio sp. TaxID=2795000 RepID=UPI003BA9EFE5